MRKLLQKLGIVLACGFSLAILAIYLIQTYRIGNRVTSSGSNSVSEEVFNVVDPPNPLPECSIEYSEESLNDIKILVQDNGDGLYRINILKSDNVTVHVPDFNTDVDNLAPKNVLVLVTKVDKSKTSSVVLEAFDLALGRIECDSGDF
jgi:hypothetical protein